MGIRSLALMVFIVPGILTGCSDGNGRIEFTSASTLGEPLESLTAEETAAFYRGRLLFDRRFRPGEGLGRLFNTASCVTCHADPVSGGSSKRYRNFFVGGFLLPTGQVFPLFPAPSIVLPSYAGLTEARLPIAPAGTPIHFAQRNGPPLYGVGLFERVSNTEILSRSDPDDLDADGISGRPNIVENGNVGRFGYKCQANNIESFVRGAAFNQMGLTTNPVLGNGAVVSLRSAPPQVGVPGDPIVDDDGVPDPEISVADIADLIAFNRNLRPPEKSRFSASARSGEGIFEAIGCAKCHVPVIASSLGPVAAYTDLLIHDMGAGLADGIIMSSASGSEFRTQPLWGVSLSGPWLHDGSADTLEDAIQRHGGEAEASRAAFAGLSQGDRNAVIAFLEAL